MSTIDQKEKEASRVQTLEPQEQPSQTVKSGAQEKPEAPVTPSFQQYPKSEAERTTAPESARPIPREKIETGRRPRGTAAMDQQTRQEVARKGGIAVSRNRQHMAEIGRKGGQTVSKNKAHMAEIGRKGGEASRGHRS